MAGNTFVPKPGTGYWNLSGPNQGLTGLGSGPIGPSAPGYVQGTASTVPIASPKGVLGAATSATSGGSSGRSGGSSVPQGQSAPQQQQSGSSVNLPSIDDLYNGANQYLDNMIPGLQQQQQQGHQAIDTNYAGQKQQIADQIGQQQGQVQQAGTKFDQGLGSAYSQAQNTYNQLVQRNLNMYGGRGVGQALNAILGQGYQQGNAQLANQDLSGHQQLNQEGANIDQWGHTQNNTLDNWKNEAYTNIDSIFNQGMNQINQQKYQTEQAKAQAKLGLLQDVIAQRNAVDQYHMQLQSQMAMYGAMGNNQGAYGVQGYQPTGYQSAIQGALSNIAQTPTQLQQYTAQNFGGPQGGSQGYLPGQSGTDDITKRLLGQ